MSTEAVQKIIGRAIAEPTFRELLFNKPEEALAGFELTEEEKTALKALDRASLNAGAAELETRVSKSIFGFKYDSKH